MSDWNVINFKKKKKIQLKLNREWYYYYIIVLYYYKSNDEEIAS